MPPSTTCPDLIAQTRSFVIYFILLSTAIYILFFSTNSTTTVGGIATDLTTGVTRLRTELDYLQQFLQSGLAGLNTNSGGSTGDGGSTTSGSSTGGSSTTGSGGDNTGGGSSTTGGISGGTAASSA